MAMLKQGEKKVITDFKYILFEYQGRVDCDVIEVYSGVGARFLKEINGALQEILFISGNADKVELVQMHGLNHYYIRVDSVSIYAKLTDEDIKELSLSVGDKVFITNNSDLTFNLMIGFAENHPELPKVLPDIQREFEYEVAEVVNENIVLIKKGDDKRYMTCDKVTTLEEIKTNAKLWNKRKLERGVK
ncbi:hypothetical protein [Bacillus cereus group sp. MG11]|uniref:hypothetical protein n=1 Tax=Bacillus cereus group sp. MG11 TaxID=3040248 RepID=UPI0033912DFF